MNPNTMRIAITVMTETPGCSRPELLARVRDRVCAQGGGLDEVEQLDLLLNLIGAYSKWRSCWDK